MSDSDLDNLLDDDPETKYHDPVEIKSVEAMKLDRQMITLLVKKGKMDAEDGKMKIETINSMLELAENGKKMDIDSYKENLKESWKNHHSWLNQCEADDDLGTDKGSHTIRIKKRIEKIETELKSLGVDPSKLEKDEDDALLDELRSGEADDVDEISDSSDDKPKYKKSVAKPVQKMPTMEEKRAPSRTSQVVNNFADCDPEELMEKRLKEYINAIEYLKKNNPTKNQDNIMEILKKAELVKKLQKRDDVEVYEIPGEVTPDEILGISAQDRIKKFRLITEHVTK